MGAALILVGLVQPVTNFPEAPVAHAEVIQIGPTKTLATVTTVPPYIEPPLAMDNESVTWRFLIDQGFTRNQTAGIMGNLQQEHNFNTSDVPGGLGIAQWISGRRDNLIAKGDYLNLNTQLNYLMEELNGAEYNAMAHIKASTTVEEATYAFSGKFERCGNCKNETRVMYAYNILGRH